MVTSTPTNFGPNDEGSSDSSFDDSSSSDDGRDTAETPQQRAGRRRTEKILKRMELDRLVECPLCHENDVYSCWVEFKNYGRHLRRVHPEYYAESMSRARERY